MSMEIVNGYVCRNCSDVELAKKGVDPAKPEKATKVEEAKPERGPAVTYGGSLSPPPELSPTQVVQAAPYVPGSTVSLKA
jgi:hypothetical protein